MTTDVRVQQQAVTLWLDPKATLLKGEALLELVLTAPVDALALFVGALRLGRAEIHVDGARRPLRIRPDGARAHVSGPAPLPAGRLRLSLGWTGTLTRDGPGLRRFDIGGQAFASTCMAGPAGVIVSLAQPALRTSIVLTVHAPVGVSVAANARLLERRGVGSGACWRFAATPPIALHVMGIAIGPFTVTEGDAGDPQLRVLAPGAPPLAPRLPGRVRALIDGLEARAGSRFPYGALTLVGVGHPVGGAPSAGLVPVPIAHLIAGGPELDAGLARALARTWFGGLVSLPASPVFEAALARWLANQVVAPHRLELERPLDAPAAAGEAGQIALIAQGLAALHAHAPHALSGALPRFLRRHGHQTATIDDLRACLNAPQRALLPSTPPTDRVHVEWPAPDRLRLLRAVPSPTPILLRVRIGHGARVSTLPVVLDAEAIDVQLPWAPRWIHPNADAMAPVRWRLPTAALRTLITQADRLSPRERAALPGQIWDHFVADRLPSDETLDALLRCAQGADLDTVLTALFRLRQMDRRLVPNSHRATLAGWVADAVAPAWAAVGLWPRAEDTGVVTALRPWLVEAMLDARADGVAGAIVAQAERVLAGDDLDRAVIALPWAARVAGDAGYFDAIDGALTTAPSPALRPALIAALGHFTDPTLIARGLDRALSHGLHPDEWFALMRPIAQRREGRDQLRGLIERRFDHMASHLPPDLLARLSDLAHDARTASERSAWATTFAAPRLRLHGIPQAVDRMLASIDANIRLAAQASSTLRARLARGR